MRTLAEGRARITTADDDQTARIFDCVACGSGPALVRAARAGLGR
jgi:hypothetical protein